MLLKIQWGLEYMDIFLIRHSEQLKLKGIKNVEESSQIENEKIILSIEGEKKAKEICKLKELNNIDINIDERLNERKLRKFRKFKKNAKK